MKPNSAPAVMPGRMIGKVMRRNVVSPAGAQAEGGFFHRRVEAGQRRDQQAQHPGDRDQRVREAQAVEVAASSTSVWIWNST